MSARRQYTQRQLLEELDPVVAKETRPPSRGRQGVDAARVRAVERGPQLRGRPPDGEPWDASQSTVSDDRAHRARRQPAHRGQPPELPPRDLPALRPGGRVGHVDRPLDGGGGPARHGDPRLPAHHPRRRPGRARAGAHAPHDAGLRPAPTSWTCSTSVAYVSFQELATRISHRNTGKYTEDRVRRPAARAHLGGREPAHGLLPQPAWRRRWRSPRTRRCPRCGTSCRASRCPVRRSRASPGAR